MPILHVYVSDADMAHLTRHAEEAGSTADELASAAISEAICTANRHRQIERELQRGASRTDHRIKL